LGLPNHDATAIIEGQPGSFTPRFLILWAGPFSEGNFGGLVLK
jgi:hypothetical protein